MYYACRLIVHVLKYEKAFIVETPCKRIDQTAFLVIFKGIQKARCFATSHNKAERIVNFPR